MKLRGLSCIEITSRCNLRCKYCPNHKIADGAYENHPAIDMTQEIFDACMEWVKYFIKVGTQHNKISPFVNGEPLLHNDFVSFVAQMRRTIRATDEIVIHTNGLLFTNQIAKELAELKPLSVMFSRHAAKDIRFQEGVAAAINRGVYCGSNDFANMAGFDFAGHVEWKKHAPEPCPWINLGTGVVFSNGIVTSCCFDIAAENSLGTVSNNLLDKEVRFGPLCSKCHCTKTGD